MSNFLRLTELQMSVPQITKEIIGSLSLDCRRMGCLGIWVGIKSLTPSLGAVSARLARTTPPVSPMKGETFFSVTK